MQNVERIPQIPVLQKRALPDYLLDTALAIIGALLVTGIIYFSHLYPTVSDISILYLLVILGLALSRGIYASILTSIVAFLSFDFFIVPPLYSFTIAQAREWVALVVFLAVAIIASLLAATARQRTEVAREREREARILYELMRITNDAERLEDQLDIVTLSVLRVFGSWGVQACALLLPGPDKRLAVRADAPIQVDSFSIQPEELQAATEVMARGDAMVQKTSIDGREQAYYLVPLKTSKQVLGVMDLHMPTDATLLTRINDRDSDLTAANPSFFWTFLAQITSLVERGLLREKTISHNG